MTSGTRHSILPLSWSFVVLTYTCQTELALTNDNSVSCASLECQQEPVSASLLQMHSTHPKRKINNKMPSQPPVSKGYGNNWEVLAFDTDKDKSLPFLHTFPFNVTLLTMNDVDTCKHHGSVWHHRVAAYKKAVSQRESDKLLFLIDSRDVAWGGCSRDLAEEFDRLNKAIVLGAEVSCWPDPDKCADYPQAPDHLKWSKVEKYFDCDWTCPEKDKGYRFINAGFIAGRAGDLSQYFDNILGSTGCEFDDQREWNRLFQEDSLQWHHSMGLDYEASLVVNLQRMYKSDFMRNRSRVYSRLFQKEMCFVHGNGGGKEWMSEFYENKQSAAFYSAPTQSDDIMDMADLLRRRSQDLDVDL
mmetsp:Transcript_76807/g.140397  ORF Transcript_76807/g.140397 Transcript_76807/m.140397 type:complete len:358 (-) Transcript_76807:98-1171(-)